MTGFRLRPGVQIPGFQAGELHPLIESTVPEGYVFAEVDGKRRCIDSRLFEAVEAPDPRSGPDRPV